MISGYCNKLWSVLFNCQDTLEPIHVIASFINFFAILHSGRYVNYFDDSSLLFLDLKTLKLAPFLVYLLRLIKTKVFRLVKFCQFGCLTYWHLKTMWIQDKSSSYNCIIVNLFKFMNPSFSVPSFSHILFLYVCSSFGYGLISEVPWGAAHRIVMQNRDERTSIEFYRLNEYLLRGKCEKRACKCSRLQQILISNDIISQSFNATLN